MEIFVLDDPIDIGKWRLNAKAVKQAVKADIEASDDDRERYMNLEDSAGNDCAAFQMAFFIGDILVAFLLNPSQHEVDKLRADRAMQRLVEISTSPLYRFALGDPLTDSMRPVYWTPKVLVKFAHAGGLPALIGDWVRGSFMHCSTCIDILFATGRSYRKRRHMSTDHEQVTQQGLGQSDRGIFARRHA